MKCPDCGDTMFAVMEPGYPAAYCCDYCKTRWAKLPGNP